MSNVVKLADTRTMTEADARACMDRIALATVSMKLADAKLERKIAEMQANHALSMKPQEAALLNEARALKDYILGHPDRFQKPRSLETSMGQFGMRKVSHLQVPDDEDKLEAVIQWLLDRSYDDCVETTHKLVKKALRKRVAGGESVPGVGVTKGTEAFYKVTPSVVKTALVEAGVADAGTDEEDEEAAE